MFYCQFYNGEGGGRRGVVDYFDFLFASQKNVALPKGG